MTPEEILKQLVSECFFVDYEGRVGWNFNEAFDMQNDKPELANAIKAYITEVW